MAECYICFVSGSKAELVDGISSEGVVKVCRKCAESENIPVSDFLNIEQIFHFNTFLLVSCSVII